MSDKLEQHQQAAQDSFTAMLRAYDALPPQSSVTTDDATYAFLMAARDYVVTMARLFDAFAEEEQGTWPKPNTPLLS